MTVLEALKLAMETLNGIIIPVPQLQTIYNDSNRACVYHLNTSSSFTWE